MPRRTVLSLAQRDRIIELAMEGKTTRHILKEVDAPNLTKAYVNCIICVERKIGEPIPYRKAVSETQPRTMLVPIGTKARDALRAAANARGVTTAVLAARLLQIIAKDKMIDAVMDDDRQG